ncbi:hypothetical protein ACLKA7_003462 [Drosophila subpalustris]
MFIKLLLFSQMLMLSCSWNSARAEDAYASTTIEPIITTTLPEIVPDDQATASPDEKLVELNEAVALDKSAVPEPAHTTPPPESTTVLPQKQQPHAHPPYPFPYPHPYGIGYNPLSPESPESASKPKSGAAEYPAYPYLGYPILRSPYSPYSPYGSPLYHRHPPPAHYPGFSPELGYGNPPSPNEKPKSDEKKEEEKEEEEEKQPAQPSFGYPPLYVIQRRPLIPSYGNPSRGYGTPYAYGRY